MLCHVKEIPYLYGEYIIKNKMKSYMPKIQKLSANISPFAGISYVNAEFNRCGLSELIDTELGVRGQGGGYSYSDIFRTWFDIFFCGGECAEDVQVHLGPSLKQIPDNSVPSADSLLRGIKELAVDNTQVVSTSDKTYQFNINDMMNGLLIKSLLLTKQLVSGQSYDFDYDNQILAHEKYDAKKTYKKNTGYFPGIASLGRNVIYVENRDGNANACTLRSTRVKTGQAETLKRIYGSIKQNGMSVNRSRMDAGTYSEDIVDGVID